MVSDFWQDKIVLVTGHTGFKGSWLSLWLHELGAQVIGYALDAPTKPSLFQLSGLEDVIISVRGDVRDLTALQATVLKYQPHIVFHLAAQSLVRPSYDDPVETYSSNVMGTVNVLEVLRNSTCARVCQIITTDKCYENLDRALAYRETDRLGGYDPYSSSKACAELVVSSYRNSFFSGKNGTLDISTVRAGNVIGGGDWAKDRIVPDCIRSLQMNQAIDIRHPDAVRPWQYVLEPLLGYLTLAEKQWHNPAAYAEAWNFGPGSESEVSVRNLVDSVVKVWGQGAWRDISSPNAAKHEAPQLRLDVSKARHRLGWMAVYSFEQAIEQTVSWYKQTEHLHTHVAVRQLCAAYIANYSQAAQGLRRELS